MYVIIGSHFVPLEGKFLLIAFVIEIDYQLNFDTHISTICRKASQQLNIIKRLGPYLNRFPIMTYIHPPCSRRLDDEDDTYMAL
jgi:hypothetical protein